MFKVNFKRVIFVYYYLFYFKIYDQLKNIPHFCMHLFSHNFFYISASSVDMLLFYFLHEITL